MKTIQSVTRACQLLQRLRDANGDLALHELASTISVHPSTAYRLLGSLQEAGFVTRDELTGRYRLWLEPITMSGVVVAQLEVFRVADPELRRLAHATNQTVNFGIRYDDELLNIDQIASPDQFRSFNWLGQRAPLHIGATARALFAFLPEEEVESYIERKTQQSPTLDAPALRDTLREIRHHGYAVNRGEVNPNIFAVGAPIIGRDGLAAAAVSVVGFRDHFSDEGIASFVPLLLRSTETISRQLGYDPRPYFLSS